MNIHTRLILILSLMSLLSLFSFCRGKNRANDSRVTVQNGPLTIQKDRVTERRFDMNRGGMVKSAYSKYRVFYRDQPIKFPDALQSNTGYASVWKAFVLEDAPRPAVIAGSQSMYLITEAGDSAAITPLSEQHSNFASVQWLDSENGQPGPKREIYISEDTSANLSLRGGEYLLVNELTVLRVSDLSLYPFRKSIDFTMGYYAGRARGFSPDRNWVVFDGSKDSEERYDKFIYALLAYNYRTNAAYAVPFDQTETRLYNTDHITTEWINTYFEWDKKTNGDEVLQLRKLDQLPNWQGIFTQSHSYELTPVKEDILPYFLDFVKKELELSDEAVALDAYGDYKPYRITKDSYVFSVGYMEKLNMVSFSKSFLGADDDGFKAIVERVGKGFDAELDQGKYQDLFLSY
ncbi:hypothetical protein [Flavilitoribacter nigricans]|uniref:Uncharacterized protein n=1 Tax=Flavilitoribacter nigricans (strain ATCC 23147 / DSM 23189 / NBRC 102662 / NCIMB 1420 / SS-2) TaxID=1122177 RepID=A0A2D0NI54_FLAN2|nr:hypothetical protein [Flavilitoribacter nigricans]PHN07849.1 hypothetical protein CRP01_03610 [Flavilitoribacter nigricans DSM 23189 = NBRC 102662]